MGVRILKRLKKGNFAMTKCGRTADVRAAASRRAGRPQLGRISGAVATLIFLVPGAATACSAIADDAERLACYDGQYRDVKLIRCTDAMGTAICEVLSPSADNMVSCVAMDKEGKPIARGVGASGGGGMFSELDAALIAGLDCQLMR